MVKNITVKQQQELEHIKDWCITIIDFIIKKGGVPIVMTEIKRVVNNSYAKKNLRGLRTCSKDLNEWAKGFSDSDVSELNILLTEKCGENLTNETKKTSGKIKQIIKRGKINNENEYRTLLSKVDEIYDDNRKKNEVEALNKLLIEYDKHHK